MAVKLFTLFSLCVFLHIVFSFPIGDEAKSLVGADETSVLSQSVSTPSENGHVKLNVGDGSTLVVVKRMKRDIMNNGECSAGQRWLMNQCVSEEEYLEMMGEDKR
ncbi:uncharacterized protein LOC111348033 [Spodoptera litura]|uniref:Uncharacterized protein LOC111348033 n=1 Tax=Spodoptera litura TaxID=69820 RepID=A0A9J7DQ78_SPOLT|nr:uncharacterized protein LOC111348033 [Spodoptera litura]